MMTRLMTDDQLDRLRRVHRNLIDPQLTQFMTTVQVMALSLLLTHSYSSLQDNTNVWSLSSTCYISLQTILLQNSVFSIVAVAIVSLILNCETEVFFTVYQSDQKIVGTSVFKTYLCLCSGLGLLCQSGCVLSAHRHSVVVFIYIYFGASCVIRISVYLHHRYTPSSS